MSVGGDAEREIKTLSLPQIPEISLTPFPTSSLEWLNIISVAGRFITGVWDYKRLRWNCPISLLHSYPCSHMLFYSKYVLKEVIDVIFLTAWPGFRGQSFPFSCLSSIPSASGNTEDRVTSLLLSLTANIVHTLKFETGIVFQLKGSIDPWTLLLWVSGTWYCGPGSALRNINSFLVFLFLNWKKFPHYDASGSEHPSLVRDVATWKWKLSCLPVKAIGLCSTVNISPLDLSVLKHILSEKFDGDLFWGFVLSVVFF